MKHIKQRKRTALDREIELAVTSMEREAINTDAYTRAAQNVKTLCEARALLEKPKTNVLSKNTMAVILGNVAIFGISYFGETIKYHGTKLTNFILKGKIE